MVTRVTFQFVPLLSGPARGTARIVHGHWQLSLNVVGINRDNPEGYLFSLKDARIGEAD